MQDVVIINGSYRNNPITNERAKLIGEIKMGAKGWFANFELKSYGTIRVQLPSKNSVKFLSPAERVVEEPIETADETVVEVEETDEQIIERIESRFAVLNQVTAGIADGNYRSLIVSGAPGIGKSAGINATLESKLGARGDEFDVVSGSIVSAYNLYQTLYDNRDKVLVLDDCDSLLFDGNCVNLLKAALDSGDKPRMVSYKSDSVLQLGLPVTFEFTGSIIFITNIDFQKIIEKDRSAQAKHLSALTDRSLYLDLTLHTRRDIWCRISSMVTRHNMLAKYKFTNKQITEMLDYMKEKEYHFRSFSLRTVVQLAQFMQTNPNNWRDMSEAFQMKRKSK